MNSENNPNVNVSATTSPSAPPKQAQRTAEPPDDKKSTEADFLTREQDQARAAIQAVLTDMKQSLAKGVDVREWTRQHPLIMAGTATVAGFVAGMLVVPSKKETFKDFFGDKWEAFKDKMTPPATATAAVGTTPPSPQPEKTSALGVIVREAMKMIGPALGGLITAAMARQEPQPGDGHPADSSYAAAESTARTPPA